MTQTIERPTEPPPPAPEKRDQPARWRWAKVCSAVVATSFVFGPAAGHLAGSGGQTLENRNPAPAPALADGWDGLDKVGPWAADHVPGRSRAVRANAWIDHYLLGEVPLARAETKSGVSVGPTVIRGKNGYLFLHQEFKSACALSPGFEAAVRSMLKLAEIIEASGRQVVFAVAPDKSSVLTGQLPKTVPTGDCAKRGLARQIRVLDGLDHRLAVDLRAALAKAPGTGVQPFWHTDTHWTTAGAAIYAKALAARLDPDLAAGIRTTPGVGSRVGDLTKMMGLSKPETAQSVTLSTGTTVTPDPAYDRYDPQAMHYGPQRWTSTPAANALQGNTVLLGDSFMYHALGNLRPLFANGTFLWTGYVPNADIVAALKTADTVVIEVVERTVSGQHPFARRDFHEQVAAALRRP